VSKTPDPSEVARDRSASSAEDLVTVVTERVVPLAREAVEQLSPVAQAAVVKTAALVQAAAEHVGPLTQQAVEAVTPYAQQARDAVTPYAQTAASAVAPYAATAAAAAAPYAQSAAGRLEPAYGAARDALSTARERVTTEVLPAVGAAATGAAASAAPLLGAATERGRAVVRAARGEQAVVVPPPKKKRGWLTTFGVAAAAAAATYVVVRKLVGDNGSQWQTARPSTPYVPPTSAAAASGATTVSDAGTDQQTGPSAHDAYRAADGAAEPDQPAEGGVTEADDPLSSGTSVPVAEPSTTSLYGAGQPAGDVGTATGTDEDAAAIAARNERTDHVADVDEATTPSPRRAAGSSGGSTGSTSGASDSSPTWAGDEGGDRPADGEARTPYGDDKLKTELETVQERAYEEPEDAVTTEQDTAMGVGPDAHPERYAGLAGVYLGVEPPTGYLIKGNERSMKYHVPDSNSYGRTIAEIWFESEDAARQAGFTPAEH